MLQLITLLATADAASETTTTCVYEFNGWKNGDKYEGWFELTQMSPECLSEKNVAIITTNGKPKDIAKQVGKITTNGGTATMSYEGATVDGETVAFITANGIIGTNGKNGIIGTNGSTVGIITTNGRRQGQIHSVKDARDKGTISINKRGIITTNGKKNSIVRRKKKKEDASGSASVSIITTNGIIGTNGIKITNGMFNGIITTNGMAEVTLVGSY